MDQKLNEMVKAGCEWIRVFNNGEAISRGNRITLAVTPAQAVIQLVSSGYSTWTIGNGYAKVHMCRKEVS